MRRTRGDLSEPRLAGRRLRVAVDPESFGRFSEEIARVLGTARFLIFQTVVVAIWIAINLAAASLRWDPYPFILLNLAFSTQAAYAAPLILLAQARQAERDRAESERDRASAERTQADAEYLSREVASIRLALDDAVSSEALREELLRLREAIERLEARPAT